MNKEYVIPEKGIEYKRPFKDLIVDFLKTYWPSIVIPLVSFLFLYVIYYFMTEKNIDKLENRLNQRIIEVKHELENSIVREKYNLLIEVEKLKLKQKGGK